ncbi:MAG: hypothetical protein PVG65_06690 [Candidatus Thorarchaeota archaeon]|jgi:hypothetical protein
MEKEKDIEIKAVDVYGDTCLNDSVNKPKRGVRRPQGFVEIYDVDEDGNKKLVGKHNLVVYLGREMLAQRLVNTDNGFATPTKDEFLAWLGLGDGGADPADPFDPVAPAIDDDDLESRVMINATDSSNADYHVAGVGYPETGYYKKPFQNVEFEADSLNDNRWFVVKITVAISSSDSNGNELSEAGLFSAESSLGGYSGQFSLFARVTFPTIVKTSSRRLVFVWYLYL